MSTERAFCPEQVRLRPKRAAARALHPCHLLCLPVLLRTQVPELNSQALAALTDMGFSEELCRNALLRGRNRFEPALEWLLAHADDPHAANPLRCGRLVAGCTRASRAPAPI